MLSKNFKPPTTQAIILMTCCDITLKKGTAVKSYKGYKNTFHSISHLSAFASFYASYFTLPSGILFFFIRKAIHSSCGQIKLHAYVCTQDFYIAK